MAFVAQVIRRNKPAPEPPMWEMKVNRSDLGEYPDRDAGFRRVEETIVTSMLTVAEDWEAYLAAKGKL